LWHWPLLALARIYDFGRVSLTRDLTIVLIALGLAALTYTMLENPVRRGNPWPFTTALQTVRAGFGLSTALACVAITVFYYSNALAARDPWLSALKAARQQPQSPEGCHIGRRFQELPAVQSCQIGQPNAPTKILLWGDSHAEHLVGMLRANAVREGYNVIVRTMSACPPLIDPASSSDLDRDCANFNAAVAHEIPALVNNGLRGIVVSSRSYALLSSEPAKMALWQRELGSVLELARKARLRVLLIGPIPTFALPAADCLAHLTPSRCGLSRAGLKEHQALIAALKSVAGAFDNSRLLDLADAICGPVGCLPVREGTILLSDDNHLSVAGSQVLSTFASSDLAWLRQ
jgi:hypothetical protein